MGIAKELGDGLDIGGGLLFGLGPSVEPGIWSEARAEDSIGWRLPVRVCNRSRTSANHLSKTTKFCVMVLYIGMRSRGAKAILSPAWVSGLDGRLQLLASFSPP